MVEGHFPREYLTVLREAASIYRSGQASKARDLFINELIRSGQVKNKQQALDLFNEVVAPSFYKQKYGVGSSTNHVFSEPLYGFLLSQFDAKIPRGHWIWANQTYVPYIPETKILSGAYHYGIDEGDAYSVAMWLMSSKDGFPRYVERNHGARETIYTDRTTNDLRISTAGLAATHLVSKMLFGEQ